MAVPVDAPDWWAYVDYIRLIDTINTIGVIAAITNILNVESVDLIDRITLIDTITDVGTIANITDVGTVNLINTITTIAAVNNILNVASVDLIDRITLIDDITNIDTINTINTLWNVMSVVNIASVDLIDRITRIDQITNIDRIKRVGMVENLIRNGDFETGDFTGWILVETPEIETSEVYEGDYSCKLTFPAIGMTNGIYQNIPPLSSNIVYFSLMYKTTIGKKIKVVVYYTDGTSSNHEDVGDGEWLFYGFVPTADKILKALYVYPSVPDSILYVDDLRCVRSVDSRQIRALTVSDVVSAIASQATRSNLKVQPEREDLYNKGSVVSPDGAGVLLLAGVPGEKIKVYDAGYEATVDGLHCFYFGTSTALGTRRFLSRNTIGVIRQTFVQPRVGVDGYNLYLYSAAAESNMPYDLNYTRE